MAQYFRIYGMDCAEEVAILKRELGPRVGEDNLAFDLLNAKMSVSSEAVTSDEVIKAVSRTGMRAESWRDVDAPAEFEDTGFWSQHARSLLAAVSAAFLILGFAVHVALEGSIEAALGTEGAGQAHSVPWIVCILYSTSIVAGARFVLPKAFYAARQLRPDMNLLMVLAVIGAMAIGEWFEAATVTFLFAVSLWLESWSIGRARRAVSALLKLAPTMIRVRQSDGREIESPPERINPGTVFVIRPGERIGLDGIVVTGTSEINQAPVTGESVPVPKKPEDPVFAGTINGDGALEVRSTKSASDTTLARIIRMVADAQSRRAPSEQWVERFARYYTPAILILSLLIFLIPPVIFGQPWVDWLYRALVMLVIGCPCALVISTPVSIVAALTAAAKNGVLIKGGTYVELPAQLRAIALDKTGTITEGKPKVVEIVALNDHTDNEVIECAAALEANSGHPLAEAIVQHAAKQKIAVTPAEDFQTIQGKGAVGSINRRRFWLGSHKLLEERGQDTPQLHARIEAMARGGRTIVVIGNDQGVWGVIALADAVRPTSKQAIADLHQAGVKKVIMLTGDNRATAEVIAREAGIDEVKADLLPDQKVAALEELLNSYGKVGMVGDGVNDAPALARSTVGIAMGAIGSDAAIETADIALMSDDLSKLPWLIRHSHRTLNIIRQNIGLSLAVKILFLALTLAGAASLWSAIAADMGTSLLVVFNGLRLLRHR